MTKCKICNQFNPTSYMVKNSVWIEAGFEPNDIVCFKCLEKKLRRKLELSDFPKYKINDLIFFGTKLERKNGKQNFRIRKQKRNRRMV